MTSVATRYLASLILALAVAVPASAAHLELTEGDRVVLLGGTLIEREQTYGYWEAMLTSHFPTRNVIFRNLGWSGDTVWGESRAGFGTVADGYQALVEHVEALRPTVIIVGYGAVESFAGEPGLPRFIAGVNTLLDSLRRTKARIVILAPLKLEKLPSPLPDPQREDKNVWHYIDALHEVAVKQDDLFLDLNRWLEPLRESTGRQLHLTDDTMHLTDVGYWMTAGALENDLQLRPAGWKIELDKSGRSLHTSGGKLTDAGSTDGKLRFAFTSSTLPITAALRQPGRNGVVRVEGLPAGEFVLAVDGQPIATAAAHEWGQGVAVDCPAELKQIEQLRQAIVQKNELYFHRWRPQNQTYLLGFRKHEQGQNAQEIVQFDPLVAAQEQQIARLCVPVAHRYELVRSGASQP